MNPMRRLRNAVVVGVVVLATVQGIQLVGMTLVLWKVW